MALSRRQGNKFQSSIWPGFVDAMTGLLLVLMFVLTIFMVVQFVLRETIKGQGTELDHLQNTVQEKDAELNDLAAQIAALGDALGLEQKTVSGLQDQVAGLNQDLETARTEGETQRALIATLTTERDARVADLTAAQERLTNFEAQVAQLLLRQQQAETQISNLTQQRDDLQGALETSQGEAANLTQALVAARDEIDAQLEAARLAAAKRQLLEQQLETVRQEAQDTQLSLSETLALLATERDKATTLLQSNTELEVELSDLEKQRLEELAAAKILQEKLEQSLTAEQQAKLAESAAVKKLQAELDEARDEITTLDLALNEQRKKAEDTLTLLAAARAAGTDLDERLAIALIALEAANAAKNLTQEELDAARGEGEATTQKLRDALAKLKLREQELGDLRSNYDLRETQLVELQGDVGRLAAAVAAQKLAEDEAKAQLSEAERQAILLSEARKTLAQEEAKSAEAMRQVEVLNQQLSALRTQLSGLQGLLDASEERAEESQVQIQNLGSRLNSALAEAASANQKRLALEEAERKRLEEQAKTLEAAKSEFLAQMRGLLEGREGVRLVGDRFVFSSEVLFAPGRADLSEDGKAEIAKVANLLQDLIDQIPAGINWVLQVDGHTDNQPLSRSRGEFENNWELSQARALSVVLFMISDMNLPPDRLSANGFGEYQPLNPADTREARAQNRRIELKFTEK